MNRQSVGYQLIISPSFSLSEESDLQLSLFNMAKNRQKSKKRFYGVFSCRLNSTPELVLVSLLSKHSDERMCLMNAKKLRVVGVTFGLALCVAAGLIVFTAVDKPALAKGDAAASNLGPSPAPLQALSDAFADVAARVKPSVVTVYSEKTVKMPYFQWPFGDDSPFRWFFGDDNSPRPRRSQPREYQFRQSGMGSGIVIDKEGHILTNNHVVRDMDQIKVRFPGSEPCDAVVVGTDPRSDIAVIKIKDKLPRGIVPADLGDSDAIRVGDWVLAVGAPFGYEQTVTAGIISAKGRTRIDNDADKYEDFIQTDAAINPGNSGGPLVDLKGEVIGINTAIATSIGQFAGVGFAIPINMAKHVIRDLITSGKVTRGFLGIGIKDLDEDTAKDLGLTHAKGVLVKEVQKDGAAEKAGIKPADVILRYDGKDVVDSGRLRNLVADTKPGTKVQMVVVRDGKERTLNATVGELASGKSGGEVEGEESKASSDLGLSVAPLTADAAKRYGLDEDEKGVVVTDVDEGSPAAAAELQPGDLITEVNREKVTTVSEFRAALDKATEKKSILMLVKRQGGSFFVIVRKK
jgi:serine protease Do